MLHTFVYGGFSYGKVFQQCANPGRVKKAIQRLVEKVYAEYDRLFKMLKDRHESKSADGSQDSNKAEYNNMKYDFSEDAKLREVLQKIINFDGINIEFVGCWIWVDGNTYGYKDALKEIGFKWAREKKKWYFHTEAFRKKSHKKLSMDDIRNFYGSTEVEPDGTKKRGCKFFCVYGGKSFR